MKVIIQIPCLNESETLPMVFENMPKHITGVDDLEYLVIDDGSNDNTGDTAKKLGVHHIIRHVRTQGLGRSFHDGAMKALELGADILVNTDGDNQYPSERIPDLVRPILLNEADIVIADRQTQTIKDFSPMKKFLQKIGSKIVNLAADTNLPDTTSGFRAYSREALMQINTVTRFSYCLETIIQAGNKHLAISSITITTNPKTRESRLFKSMWEHVLKSALTIIRAYIMYKPTVVFVTLGSLFLVSGLVPFIRFLFFVAHQNGAHHLQSLIAGSILLTAAFISYTLGVIADLIRINRILSEDILELQKRKLINHSQK